MKKSELIQMIKEELNEAIKIIKISDGENDDVYLSYFEDGILLKQKAGSEVNTVFLSTNMMKKLKKSI